MPNEKPRAEAIPAGNMPPTSGFKYPPTFWYANGAELCERFAFYGMFITLVRYLNQDIGFTDIEVGWITALFASILYFLPTFMGIMADKIGFKQALIIAFVLLTGGYGLLGIFQYKASALTALTLIMFGGAIIKPVISGTVAKTSDSAHRAQAMSIFYMVVNIGAFSGKALAGPLNENLGMQYINYYAAGMSFIALFLVIFFYRDVDREGTGKTVGEALRGLGKVMVNFRFLALILIVGGFWAIQTQLYGAMPTYIERTLGVGYKPEWLANINPLVVVLLVVPITHTIRHFRPENAIGIGLFIIPLTALVIGLAPALEGATGGTINLGVIGVHPLILMVIIGIALQGLAECFLSPKFLEYASKQAPPGEVGLYLGYQHLTTFFAYLFGFIGMGYLLHSYCPDPRKDLEPEVRHEWRLATMPQYRFTLDADAAADLPDAPQPVPAAIYQAFAQHDLPLPEDALIRPGAEADSGQDWHVAWNGRMFTIRVEELETEAEARAQQRDIPQRDVLVLSDQARTDDEMPALPEAYARAHYVWYVFAGVGFAAFLALLVFKFVTQAIDAGRRDAATPTDAQT